MHAIAIIAALVLYALIPEAYAQPFPSKPIRIVVGFPPGGPADFTARLLADKLPGLLGTNVIVENRVGANATIGADYVAKSAPDGHTLFLTTCGAMAISPHLIVFRRIERRGLQPMLCTPCGCGPRPLPGAP